MLSFFKQQCKITDDPNPTIQQMIIAGFLGALLNYVSIELLSKFQNENDDSEHEPKGISPLELNVIDPIIEEFINRYIVISLLEAAFNKAGVSTPYTQLLSWVGSSFIFSKLHKPAAQTETFLAGLVYGGLYQYYNKKILPSSVAHIINNLLVSYLIFQDSTATSPSHTNKGIVLRSAELAKALFSPCGGWIEGGFSFIKKICSKSTQSPTNEENMSLLKPQ